MVSLGNSEISESARAPMDLHVEQVLVRQWLFETWLARIRWGAIPITLILALAFPTIPVALVIFVAVLAGTGNAWIAMQLGRMPDPSRVHRARWAATALDWVISIGCLVLFSPDMTYWTPGLLLLLIITTAFRFGVAGLVAAAVLASIAVTGATLAALFVDGTYDADFARSAWLGWMLLIGAAGCVGNGLIRANREFDQWEHGRWDTYGSILPRFQLGITDREWQVLQHISRDGATYREIADELSVSPDTVKTHVRNLGAKLGVSGRHKVVAAARQHGLLPDMRDADGPDTPA